MKNFQFGVIRPHLSGKGTIGQFALHVQCPWRVVDRDRIITGSTDYYEPVEADLEVDLQDRRAGNLQRKRLSDLLGSHDGSNFIVESVLADGFGGLDLELSDGLRLQVFPCGSRGEDWRFLAPGTEEDHLVIDGGCVSLVVVNDRSADK